MRVPMEKVKTLVGSAYPLLSPAGDHVLGGKGEPLTVGDLAETVIAFDDGLNEGCAINDERWDDIQRKNDEIIRLRAELAGERRKGEGR